MQNRHPTFSRVNVLAARCAPAIVLTAFVAACGDETSPSEPERTVATVAISPDSIELGRDETTTLTASARDAAGNDVPGRTVAWSSTNPAVAEVDASGRVNAKSPGSATVRAQIDGQTGDAAVIVVPWSIDSAAVVVDSTALRLTSDAAQLATGTYRFERLTQSAPAIAAGAVIVGAQGGGFLRRVTSVQSAGTTLTLATAPVSLVEVVRHGSFESTVNLASAPATLLPGAAPAEGEVLWGGLQVVDALAGVSLGAAGLDLSGVDICAAINCPDEIETFELASGTVQFDPSVTVAATIENYDVTEFDAIASGDLTFDFAVLLEAEQSTDFERSATLATIQRVFYAQIGWLPVVGLVQFEVKAEFAASATVKGKIQAGFENRHSATVGARYRAATGWAGVLEGSQQFDAYEPSLGDSTLVGQIELEAKISVTPELRILLYGVAGPFINVEPYGKVTLSFGTQSCKIESVAGIESSIGFTIPMLDPDVGTFEETFSPFTWPGLDWDCPLGHVDVAAITNGQDPDTDGYTILVDGKEKGAITSNGNTLVQWLQVGSRSVELQGINPNCTVQGANPRDVNVQIGLVTPVNFDVDCDAGVLSIAGAWTLTVDGVCQGPLNVTQNGTSFQVTGSLGGPFCPFTASGSGSGQLDGTSITFGIAFGSGSSGGGGGLGSVNFTGTVNASGTSMSGTYSGAKSGQWSATR